VLDVPRGVAAVRPFVALYLNDGLTLGFLTSHEAFPIEHFCFRVMPPDFDAIVLARCGSAASTGAATRAGRSTTSWGPTAAGATSAGTSRTGTGGRC
jgi:hypothetical protein